MNDRHHARTSSHKSGQLVGALPGQWESHSLRWIATYRANLRDALHYLPIRHARWRINVDLTEFDQNMFLRQYTSKSEQQGIQDPNFPATASSKAVVERQRRSTTPCPHQLQSGIADLVALPIFPTDPRFVPADPYMEECKCDFFDDEFFLDMIRNRRRLGHRGDRGIS